MSRSPDGPAPDATRMTLGEHLDELRGCVVRALVGFLVAAVLCIWPAGYILQWIAQPALVVLREYDQAVSFLATSPAEPLLIYVKTVAIAAITIAGPYVIYQLWRFVASGLYANEKRWAYRLVPASVGLFIVGVAFMYTLVLPLSLKFFVGFAGWLPAPSLDPTALQRLLLGESTPPAASAPAGLSPAQLPVHTIDPPSAAPGDVWFNEREHRVKLRGSSETFSFPVTRDGHQSLVTMHFRLQEYLSFVLMLTIAFGAAFQMPLVVYFLAASGIVPLATLRAYRKIVILVIVVVAGAIAPPDLISHILLSVPMVLLFELGLLIAARSAKRAAV